MNKGLMLGVFLLVEGYFVSRAPYPLLVNSAEYCIQAIVCGLLIAGGVALVAEHARK